MKTHQIPMSEVWPNLVTLYRVLIWCSKFSLWTTPFFIVFDMLLERWGWVTYKVFSLWFNVAFLGIFNTDENGIVFIDIAKIEELAQP